MALIAAGVDGRSALTMQKHRLEAADAALAVYWSPSHAMHSACPALLWYCPRRQSMQAAADVDPLSALYLPAAQPSHEDVPARCW